MTPSLCVITPTCARRSLSATIASVVDQLEDCDTMIVVGDDHLPAAREMVADFQPANLFYVEGWHAESTFGNHQRDVGLMLAVGRSSHVMFLDDDDVCVHGALDRVRECVNLSSTAAHIFKATWGPGHHWHGTLWAEPVVREQNFGTCQLVLPNRPFTRKWMDSNDRGTVSDYAWMSAAIGECDGVCWHDDLIAVVRPS